MNKRDLKKDLGILESITKNVSDIEDMVYEVVAPHALRRAIAAEEENERLRDTLYQVQVRMSRESYMAAEDIVDSAIQRIQRESEQDE